MHDDDATLPIDKQNAKANENDVNKQISEYMFECYSTYNMTVKNIIKFTF